MQKAFDALEPRDLPGNSSGVTIRDVAKAAHVSVATVSNVLNHSNLVALPTQAKVQRAINELGFVRHVGAALMRGGRGQTLGLVVRDLAMPFFTEIARGAESVAREQEHLVILCNSDEDAAQEQRYFEALEGQRVKGILLSTVSEKFGTLDEVHERGTAVVLLGTTRPGYCSVGSDDTSGGEMGANHLLDLGHTNLLFVGPSHTFRPYRERFAGAKQALANRGLDPDSLKLIVTDDTGSAKDGQLAAEIVLGEMPEITGIICSSDLIAIGLVAALMRRGVDVPGDISVVGYDDVELASEGVVPLSSVSQPMHDIGRTATRLLLDEAEQGVDHPHQQTMFQPQLVIRESTSTVRLPGTTLKLHDPTTPHNSKGVHGDERQS